MKVQHIAGIGAVIDMSDDFTALEIQRLATVNDVARKLDACMEVFQLQFGHGRDFIATIALGLSVNGEESGRAAIAEADLRALVTKLATVLRSIKIEHGCNDPECAACNGDAFKEGGFGWVSKAVALAPKPQEEKEAMI